MPTRMWAGTPAFGICFRRCSFAGLPDVLLLSLTNRCAMTGIAEWLASIGLGDYAQRFAENAIDLSVVRDLTEQDLKDLGVLLGHRRKMLRAIAELKGDVLRTPQTGARPVQRDA